MRRCLPTTILNVRDRLILGEKLLTRLERGAYRCVEAARAQMEARLHKIPQDVRNVSLQTYYDMHASTAGSERGRQLPPLAMASLPDAME